MIACGCEEKPRPWQGGDGPAAVLSPPPKAEQGDESASGSQEEGSKDPDFIAASSRASASAPGATDTPPAPDPDAPRVTPGGGWSRCREGLALSDDPLKDVTRLTLMCGPSNGMRRKARQAIVGLVGEREPAVTSQVRVTHGACYRVFAVGDVEVADLDVTVRSSRGVAIAGDHGAGRLAIVQADRPFCVLEDDVVTVEISARRGAGRFAAEVWSLGERWKKGETLENPPDEPPLETP